MTHARRNLTGSTRLCLAHPATSRQDAVWEELPDRSMEWSPVLHHATAEWQPEWLCLRCQAVAGPQHALFQNVPAPPVCPAHGRRSLALDLREGQRGWVCCHSPSATVLPCQPEVLPVAETAPPAQPAPGLGAWASRGPPAVGSSLPATHSWFHVPVLHAGVRRLGSSAVALWDAHPDLRTVWGEVVQALQEAPPVSPHDVVAVLHAVQQSFVADGRALSQAEAALLPAVADAARVLPAAAVWELVVQADGYIHALAQEALLLTFLGERRRHSAVGWSHFPAPPSRRRGPPTVAAACVSRGLPWPR